MSFISFLKKIPIDLGQGNLRTTTKGKLIALSLIPKPKEGAKALDVGCREGHQSKKLEKMGYTVTSIDIEKSYDKCEIVNVDEGLPYEENSFDLIWSSEVIEHLINPRFAVQEFVRVLKPGGKMVLTTPNSFCIVFRIISLFGLTPQKTQRKDHLHFFDLTQIRRIVPKAKLYGYFPYMILKFKISSLVGLLSPTFVIELKKPTES